MKKLMACIGLFLYAWSGGTACAQDQLAQAIDSLIRLKEPRAFNGVVLIVRGEQVLYSRSYGFRDLRSRKALQLTDQFLIASNSKQITATLVLREVAAGRISLDQSIGHYLPGFRESWKDSVTVRQLLNHTSGIANWGQALAFVPGSKFAYSNINYNILGQILEKAGGRSFEQLSTDLFQLCGMEDTKVPAAYHKSKSRRLVKGYVEHKAGKYTEEAGVFRLLDHPAASVPAAGIISTAADLAAWNRKLHTSQLLPDSLYQLMTSSDMAGRAHRWGLMQYGFGIQFDTEDGIDEKNNGGYFPGFISTNIYYPASGISVIVLENVAPLPSDMKRVYFFHDGIRKLVRRELLMR